MYLKKSVKLCSSLNEACLDSSSYEIVRWITVLFTHAHLNGIENFFCLKPKGYRTLFNIQYVIKTSCL